MGAEERAKHPTWAVVRYLLGVLQMTGALTGAMLLVTTGVTLLAIVVTAVTAVFLILSRLLFRGR